jgi:hypothetical protein
MLTIPELLKLDCEQWQTLLKQFDAELHNCAVGIIQDIDMDKQTCTVQLAIRETIKIKDKPTAIKIPVLLDVPFFILSGGDFAITLPIEKGDECLVLFSDLCIDAWWQNGGVQNRMSFRRHDLSDGLAIVGFRSLKNLLSGYSDNSIRIRNKENTNFIDLSADALTLQFGEGNNVAIDSEGLTLQFGAHSIIINSSGISIDGIIFATHIHPVAGVVIGEDAVVTGVPET